MDSMHVRPATTGTARTCCEAVAVELQAAGLLALARLGLCTALNGLLRGAILRQRDRCIVPAVVEATCFSQFIVGTADGLPHHALGMGLVQLR